MLSDSKDSPASSGKKVEVEQQVQFSSMPKSERHHVNPELFIISPCSAVVDVLYTHTHKTSSRLEPQMFD